MRDIKTELRNSFEMASDGTSRDVTTLSFLEHLVFLEARNHIPLTAVRYRLHNVSLASINGPILTRLRVKGGQTRVTTSTPICSSSSAVSASRLRRASLHAVSKACLRFPWFLSNRKAGTWLLLLRMPFSHTARSLEAHAFAQQCRAGRR